jgi:hypothetical protein
MHTPLLTSTWLVPALRRASLLGLLGLAACASLPTGPTYHALPGTRKTFDQFQVDDNNCRSYALARIGGKDATERANESATATAVAGTAIGAAAGGLIAGGGRGAGVGAGVGLLAGSMIGSEEARGSYRGTQRQYDAAYHQCMYAAGHKVPVIGRYEQSARTPERIRRPRAGEVIQPPKDLPPEHVPPPDAPPPKSG